MFVSPLFLAPSLSKVAYSYEFTISGIRVGFWKPTYPLYEKVGFPVFPFFVVIRITPLAPPIP